jgi:hypothetical protein
MYQRKIKIQKGFKDSIQIQFKNSDQKPVPLSTSTYWFDMIDSDGRQCLLSKPLTIIDDGVTVSTRGIAMATFDPIDTINMSAASYKFLIKKDNDDGTFTPAYSNTYYDITGEVEIVEDGYPVGYPILTVSSKELETNKEYDRNPQRMGYVFYSDWVRPVIRSNTTANTSTAVITLVGFTGEVIVEGTLDNDPSPHGQANAQAFTVVSHTAVTPTQGTIQLNWNSAVTAVRFAVRPKNDAFGSNYYPTGNPIGSNTNKYPSGFVDQIQYIS